MFSNYIQKLPFKTITWNINDFLSFKTFFWSNHKAVPCSTSISSRHKKYLYFKITIWINSNCESFSIVKHECPAISIPSLMYTSTNLNCSVPGIHKSNLLVSLPTPPSGLPFQDHLLCISPPTVPWELNSDHALSTQYHEWVACHFKTISSV